MEDYKAKYSFVINKLRKTRRKETLIMLFSNLLNAITVFLIVLLFITFIEYLTNSRELARTIFFSIIIISFILSGYYYLRPVILRILGKKFKPTLESVALRLGKFFPDIKDKLCNAIQLINSLNNSRGVSSELSIAAFASISEQIQDKNFDVIIEKKSLKKSLYYFFAIFGTTLIIFFLFNNTMGAALYRIINFNQSFIPPAPFTLILETQSQTVLKGEKITIKVKAKGTIPAEVFLNIKESQQKEYDSYALKPDSTGTYEYEIPALKSPITFFAQAPWHNTFVKTEEHSISITDLPLIRHLKGEVFYPAYTNTPPVYFDEQTADFSCLKGSKVELEIISSKELSLANIILEKKPNSLDTTNTKIDTLIYNMQVTGKKAKGSFVVTNTCSYYVIIQDTENQQNKGTIKYNIVATEDDYPSITLIEPNTDVQITESGILPVLLSISDDFGFSKLLLHYRLAASRYTYPQEEFTAIQIPIHKNEKNLEVPYIWNLNKLGISPDDIYEFYFEIFDNDIVSGPKSSRTKTLALKLPSLDEVLQSADEQQQQIERELEQIMRKAEEIKQDMNELNKELLKKNQQKELDWKDKKKAEDILKKQQELENKINQVQQSLDELAQNLQENKAISPETLEKYQELQNLLKEVNSEELKILQQKMQQALQQLSPSELQKLLKQTEFNEEMFRKSLERTINILKRLKAEQKADALNKRAEELLKKQKELEQETENTNPNDINKRNELAKKQESLQESLQNLNEELKELEKLMKELGDDMPIAELNKAQEELDYQQTSSEMQSSQSNLKEGNFQKAKQNQKKAGQNLANFANQMKKVKSELEKNVKKEAIRKLQKAMNSLIELSQKQENLQKKTKSTDQNSTTFPELGNEQSEIFSSLVNTINGLMELAQKSFAVTPDMARQLGEALQKMQRAMQGLANRSTYEASKMQAEAMSAINQATVQMQAMLSAMQNQGQGSCDNPGGMGEGQAQGAGNFMERLQQLAQQQQMLNQALQQLSAGGQLTREQQAQLGRLVQQQTAIQKSLQELNEEQKQAQNRQKQTLGNLEKIIEQMKESISELKSGQIRPETLQRQERILSRLLDASKSIHERDFEKKREATSAENIIRRSPSELDLKNQEGKKKIFDDIIRSSQGIYTKDYEIIIKQYFESLKNTNLGN